MADPKPEPKAGDPCPQCGDDFVAYRAPTDAEYAAFVHKDTPAALPPRVDRANPDQRAELGTLQVCRGCGYETRVKPAPTKAKAKGSSGE